MATPARASAPDPGRPGGRQDPLSPDWVNVRGLLVTVAEATAVAVTELEARPRCTGALRRVEALHAALEDLAEITRRLVIDQSVLDAVRADAYERGAADCKAARCHLEAVPGPH